MPFLFCDQPILLIISHFPSSPPPHFPFSFQASNAGSLDLLSAADDDAEAVSPFNLISGSFDDAEGSPMGNLGSPVGSDLDEGAPLSAPFQVSWGHHCDVGLIAGSVLART